MKYLVKILVGLMVLISSNSFIPLLKDGGARNQGFDDYVQYSGVLNYIPLIWQIVALFVVLFSLLKNIKLFSKSDRYWFLFCFFGFISAYQALYQRVAFLSVVVIFLSIFLVNLHVKISGVEGSINYLNNIFMSILIGSLFFIFLVPSYGVSVGDHAGAWQGVFTHKNSLGNFSAFLFVFYFWWILFEFSFVKLFGLIFSAILVIGSQSSTAIGNVFICSLFLLTLKNKFLGKFLFKNKNLFFFFVIFLSFSIVALSLSGSELMIFDKDSSFSNRDRVWLYYLLKIENSPWIGHGIGQMSLILQADERDFLSNVGFVVGSAHNGFLETIYSSGVFGLITILLSLFALIKRFRDYKFFVYSIVFLLFLVVLNTTESQLVGFNYIFIMALYLNRFSVSK